VYQLCCAKTEAKRRKWRVKTWRTGKAIKDRWMEKKYWRVIHTYPHRVVNVSRYLHTAPRSSEASPTNNRFDRETYTTFTNALNYGHKSTTAFETQGSKTYNSDSKDSFKRVILVDLASGTRSRTHARACEIHFISLVAL
jgi:hypothetical protein